MAESALPRRGGHDAGPKVSYPTPYNLSPLAATASTIRRMIKLTWALVADRMDEWTGEDLAEGVAVLEAKVGAVVDASGMQERAVRHWRMDFLSPVVESLRTEGAAALARGESWSKAAGPFWRAPRQSPDLTRTGMRTRPSVQTPLFARFPSRRRPSVAPAPKPTRFRHTALWCWYGYQEGDDHSR